MAEAKSAIADQTELLDGLKEYPFLAPYRLAIYLQQQVTAQNSSSSWHLHWSAEPPMSGVFYPDRLQLSLNEADKNGRPVVFTCPLGLHNFIVPFINSAEQPCCLVGSGVREEQLDLWQLESLVRSSSFPPIKLMEQLEDLPVSSAESVAETARRVQGLLPSVQADKPQANLVERVMERLAAVASVSSDIDLAANRQAALALFAEALTVLFDIPGLVVALADGNGQSYSLQATGSLELEKDSLRADVVSRLVQGNPPMQGDLNERDIVRLFPGIIAESAIVLPLNGHKELLGAIVLFDYDPLDRELVLIELLTGRLTSRLQQFMKEDELCHEHAFSSRLLLMLNKLALVENKEAFLRTTLELAAELIGASSGSIMLLDHEQKLLRIRATLGMNLQLAKSLTVKLGSGIAGKVARSGQAMVVNDIAKDKRTTGHNRPRFKTGSFISMPLQFKQLVIGVLNLSDKKSRLPFDDADLELLTSFTNHAAALLFRASNQEKNEQLERLAVIDPLTELYNRRFLDQRLEEELSRSQRNKLHLTVMLIDMDNFKLYNDLCGHAAGDRALQRSAVILKKALRDMDLITRYQGGTFCIILPATVKKEAIFVAERIRRGIEKEPCTGEDLLPRGRLTASIGLATSPEDGRLPADLLGAAESALAQAKSEGRNRICFPIADQLNAPEEPLPSQPKR